MESSSLQELEQIPGVGKTIAQDMQNIGINSIDDLRAYPNIRVVMRPSEKFHR
ncbi:MAG: helix-hairpin-helix domain-containing protein [Planctomycetota bacterium]|jgi:nucleotidyltransferase/DNA polymerase involved in DNA repair